MILDKENPLSGLRDIHLPDEVSFFPPAIGWWVLLILICLIPFIKKIIKFFKIITAKKYSLAEIKRLKNNYEQNQDAAFFASKISELLKRIAILKFERVKVANLHGAEWVAFLKETSKSKTISDKAKRLVMYAPYASKDMLEKQVKHDKIKSAIDEIEHFAEDWIRQNI